MFKSWRNDKNKIKAVFKLHFQATQVPKLKKSALVISLVPDDVGKPTFKLEKAPIQDGVCSWENPIYVSVKLIKEPKTKKINEKIYHFVVATGSSKTGFLGEASIDFADFVAETEPLTVSLPLKFANSGAVLHVTIQKIQGANDPRSIEENGDPTLSKDESFKSQQSNDGMETFYQDLAEENGSEPNTYLHNRQNSMPLTKNRHRRSNTDWSASSTSEGSFNESRNSPENNFHGGWLDDSTDPTDKHKSELEALKRQAKLTELEMQSLRKQVTKENKRTQELSREVNCLREERDELLEECEQLKLQKRMNDADAESRLRSVSEDSSNMIEEIREELNCEKDLSNNLRLQLQRTEDSNSNLILAVRDLNEMLEQKNKEISSLSRELEAINEMVSNRNANENKHQQAVDREVNMLKQTIEDLTHEVEHYRKKNEDLDMQLKRLTQEYESVKEENCNFSSKLEEQERLKMQDESSESTRTLEELESQIQRLEEKIQQQSLECSDSLITINELETEVKGLKKELEEQARTFVEDLDAMMQAKTEQEQRAIQAEDALKKTRGKNAITSERLQEKCKRLSLEMESKIEENEKLRMQAVAEADELRTQNKELLKQIEIKAKQVEEIQLEPKGKSKQFDHAQEHDEEKNQALAMKIQMLEAEIEKFAKLRENERNKASKETEMLIQEWRKERDELERRFASAKEEADEARKQLIVTRSSNDEKEKIIRNLKKEVESLSQQHGEVRNGFIQEKKEKETLRKQISQLKVDKQRKEEETSTILGTRTEESRSNEELKFPTCNAKKEDDISKLLDELEFFRKRNSYMERELKEMEERYSEISLKFAVVEGERQQLVMTVRNLKNGKKN